LIVLWLLSACCLVCARALKHEAISAAGDHRACMRFFHSILTEKLSGADLNARVLTPKLTRSCSPGVTALLARDKISYRTKLGDFN
jgi:hypothetical protein